MKIKVCGMRDAENLKQVAALMPDFVGFIFSDKSLRFVGDDLDVDVVKALPKAIKRVGVFVNASPDFVLKATKKYDLDFAQLHGSETPDYCRSLRNRGISIIKAFGVNDDFNFSMLNNYKAFSDFFLFDTKGDLPGGNGVRFDWRNLNRYDNDKPFFLSGGIGPTDIPDLAALTHLKLYGVDVNSQVEISPGLKDVEKVRAIIERLRPVEAEEAA
jgi:phosphoribosylanthranilate isomerase